MRISTDLVPATIGKLREIANDFIKSVQLKVELAVLVDVGELFVQGTYKLEGDGPLALCAYEEIRKLYTITSALHLS